mgnify:CR=1 FL=1
MLASPLRRDTVVPSSPRSPSVSQAPLIHRRSLRPPADGSGSWPEKAAAVESMQVTFRVLERTAFHSSTRADWDSLIFSLRLRTPAPAS